MFPANCAVQEAVNGPTPPISVIRTPEIKYKTKLPPGHRAQAGDSATFAVEKGLVVDQFVGLSGVLSGGELWRSPLRAVLPEPTVPKDLLDYVRLTLGVYHGYYSHRSPTVRTAQRVDFVHQLDERGPGQTPLKLLRRKVAARLHGHGLLRLPPHAAQLVAVDAKAGATSSGLSGLANIAYFTGAGANLSGVVLGSDRTVPIDFWVNTTTQMRLATTGNLGIGTTDPGSRLHIAEGSGGEQLRLSRGTGVVRFCQTNNVDDLYLYNSDATACYMVWRESGNVGVGTTGPGSRLAVSGGTTVGEGYTAEAAPANSLLVEGSVGIGTTSPGTPIAAALEIRRANATMILRDSNDSLLAVLGGQGGNCRLSMFAGGASAVQIATSGDSFFSGGDVGIGTSAPAARLHTYKASSTYEFSVQATVGTQYMGIHPNAGLGHYNPLVQAGDNALIFSPDTSALVIAAHSTDAKGLRLDNTGSLLITGDVRVDAWNIYGMGGDTPLWDEYDDVVYLMDSTDRVGIGTDASESDTKLKVEGPSGAH